MESLDSGFALRAPRNDNVKSCRCYCAGAVAPTPPVGTVASAVLVDFAGCGATLSGSGPTVIVWAEKPQEKETDDKRFSYSVTFGEPPAEAA